MNTNIRCATEGDIEELTEIFNYHVVNGYSSLRLEPETVEQRMEVFLNTSQTGPYQMLVAEIEGNLVGSARSFIYRNESIFDKTVEVGIYLDPKFLGKGVGTALYQTLLDKLQKEDVHLVVAGIALPNPASVALHKKVGFREVGIFDEYAYYRDKYYSSVWMQKRLR